MAEPTLPLASERVIVTGQRPQKSQTFNIANFRSQIDRLGGVAKTALYRVEITLPQIIQNTTKIDAQTLTFLVASVNFPGVNLTTIPVQRYGLGPPEEMPTGAVFGTCEMNILCDAEGEILKFFRNWTRSIYEYQSVPDGARNRAVPGMKPYHVNYKKNYETQITIVIYDVSGRQIYKMTLMKAYPQSQINMYLAWSNFDQIMYLPVRFQFVDIAFPHDGDDLLGSLSKNQNISLYEKIYSGASALQSIIGITNTQSNIGSIVNSINNTVLGIRQLGNLFGF